VDASAHRGADPAGQRQRRRERTEHQRSRYALHVDDAGFLREKLPAPERLRRWMDRGDRELDAVSSPVKQTVLE
jgi:hypothetical protein